MPASGRRPCGRRPRLTASPPAVPGRRGSPKEARSLVEKFVPGSLDYGKGAGGCAPSLCGAPGPPPGGRHGADDGEAHLWHFLDEAIAAVASQEGRSGPCSLPVSSPPSPSSSSCGAPPGWREEQGGASPWAGAAAAAAAACRPAGGEEGGCGDSMASRG